MTDAEIWTAVVDWLAEKSGLTVIEAYQMGDRPTLPYLMVNYTGSSEVRAHPQEVGYTEDVSSGKVLAKPIIETEWQFSLHAYAASAPSDVLRPIRSIAHLAQPNEPLLPNLVVHELSQIRVVPEVVNETWEPRAQMDLMIRGLTRDGVLIDTIEEYELTFTRV